MLFSILISLVQAAIIVAAVVGFIALCIKNPKVLVITLFVVFCLAGLVIAPTVAEEVTTKVEGVITNVAPIFADGYPQLVVTVTTFDGEEYEYYAKGKIDVTGIVTLVLCRDEVVDVY